MGFFDFFKNNSAGISLVEDSSNAILDTSTQNIEKVENDSQVVVNQNETNDGSQSMLGFGFVSSEALNRRGFRDGTTNPSNTGLQNVLELLSGEYSAFIQNKINEIDEQFMGFMQWSARIHGISEAYDNNLEALFDNLNTKKHDFEAELEHIIGNTGYIKHIQSAYKNGYVNALEKRGSHTYIPISSPSDKL